MAARRVNDFDIKQAGSIQLLIGQLVDQIKYGNMETKEYGMQLLRSLTEQPAKLEPVGMEKKRGSKGSGLNLGSAMSTIDDTGMTLAIDDGGGGGGGLSDHCVMIAQANGIKPIVALLVTGSASAQRDACGALANIARNRPDYQQRIIQAGGVVAMSGVRL